MGRGLVGLACLLLMQFSVAIDSAAAASAACTAINSIGPGTRADVRYTFEPNQFVAGDTVSLSFDDDGSQVGTAAPDADKVVTYDTIYRNFWNHYGSDGPAAHYAKNFDSAFLTGGGLVLLLRTGASFSNFTITCGNTAQVSIIVSPASGSLPAASYGTSYSQTFSATGGTAPYTFALTGVLPQGLSLSSNGQLSGAPTRAGQYSFSIKATDSASTPNSSSSSYSLTVGSAVPSAPQGVSATAQDKQATVTFTAPASDGGATVNAYIVTSSPGAITATGSASPILVTGLTNGTAYTFTVTASNAAGASGASSASNAVTPRSEQTISFPNPGARNYGTTSVLSASVTSGLEIQFTSQTAEVCTIYGNNQVFGVKPGTCIITAGQEGNAAYLPATPVTQSFPINALAPGAPTIGSATAGDQSVVVNFTAPSYTGGEAVSSYKVTASPGGLSATGSASPITVTGLTNGTAYTFTVAASNSAGPGASSAPSASVVPRGEQTLSFPNPGSRDFGTTTVLSASVTSGLEILFTSTTPSVCTIYGNNQVFAKAPGTCSVTASQAGNQAYLAAAPVTQSFAIVVPGGAVAVTTSTIPNATAGKDYQAALTATGGVAPYTWSLIDGMPAGIVLSESGVLSGSANTDGTFSIQVRVTDAAGQTDEARVQLIIDKPAISITPSSLPSGKQGEVYNQSLTAAGGTAPYQFAVTFGALPAGLSLSDAGVLNGTPSVSGRFNVQISATDRQGYSATQAFALVLTENAPVLTADTATTGANATVSIPVTANDAGSVSSITIAQSPTHGSAAVDGLEIVYTPAKDYFGSDTLAYTATGPGGTSQAASVNITVTAGALPAVADKTVTLQAGKSITIDAAEGASNGPFTNLAIVDQPSTGTVAVQGTSLTYTAPDTASGNVTFGYTLSNAFGVSAPGRIALQVNPTPVAPSIVQSAVAGRASTIDVTAGASGGPFTAAAVVSLQPASAGTATMTQTAGGYALTFVANELFSGTASVSYTLSNAFATSAVGVVSFAVQGRSDPSKDAQVVGVLSAQADATRRMATGQISNFQRRLEQLHNGQPAAGFSNGITLTSASAIAATTMADRRGERTFGPSAADDLNVTSSNVSADQSAMAPAGGTAGLLPGGASVWTGGAVNFGKAGSTRGDSSTDFTTSGLSMGADKVVANGLIIGAGVGYGHDDTDVGTEESNSKVESYSAAVYASYRPTDAFFIDSLIGYQWLTMDTVRTVSDTDGRVVGSRDGKQWFGSLSMGYILRSKDIQVTPYGRFEAAQASLDGFTERGDSIYALNYQAQTIKTSTASAGVLAQFSVKRDYGVWAPQLRAEYGRELEGSSAALMSYADLVGGNVYRANLLQQSRDHALLGGGVGLQTLGGWNFIAEYQVQLESSTGNNQSVRFGVEKKFDH
ncbi:Uncharacterized conserved protein, contains a C-terminal beta-barrel porin domain [Pseudoxanthomonas sp. GM95]|uniref:autotransporter domain-containing protein n=1 Tax=Pseudoxanthomonas sp. GM95 TaxID=1881043 RepID=UPI0008B65F98|nr:autotransporter domain-containing protein [Pseudoxanthomonas sp. GM95]SEL93661.1 Uncharacterized conserved protein, contains a C-terminal beta-barrel porin domain [Pseudoxanthomonas sp. GM95]